MRNNCDCLKYFLLVNGWKILATATLSWRQLRRLKWRIRKMRYNCECLRYTSLLTDLFLILVTAIMTLSTLTLWKRWWRWLERYCDVSEQPVIATDSDVRKTWNWDCESSYGEDVRMWRTWLGRWLHEKTSSWLEAEKVNFESSCFLKDVAW